MLPRCVEHLFPGEFPQALVEAVRIFCRESLDMKENSVGRSEMEVHPHRVGKGPFRLDSRLCLFEDGEAKCVEFPGKPGRNPFGAGDQDFAFLCPVFHGFISVADFPLQTM